MSNPLDIKLLVDRSLEIPAYLERLPDGSHKYPWLLASRPVIPNTPSATKPAASSDWTGLSSGGGEYGLTTHDKQVIAALRADEDARHAVAVRESSKRTRERKREERERLQANAKKQRLVYRQHFKWEWEA